MTQSSRILRASEKIVALSYFCLPQKYSIKYFINKIFPPKEAETGAVVKKEYQRRGINAYSRIVTHKLMLKLGYQRTILRIDVNNITGLKSAQKLPGAKVIKKTDNNIYCFRELNNFAHKTRKREAGTLLRMHASLELGARGRFYSSVACFFCKAISEMNS